MFTGKTSMHKHHHWEIVHYEGASGVAYIGDKEYEFKQGDTIIIPPGILHGESTDCEAEIFYVGIDEFSSLMEAKVYILRDAFDIHFTDLYKRMFSLYNLTPCNWRNIITGIVNVFEQYIISWGSEVEQNALIESFKRTLVEKVSDENADIRKLVKDIPISYSHFRKLFKESTGKSPKEYLTALKINNAQQLLAKTDLSIKTIASFTGFGDQCYFSRIFKAKTGKYPTEWRDSRL